MTDAARGAAFGSTRAVLSNPDVGHLAGSATAGAAFGALRGARTIGGGYADTQGVITVVDPQPYVAMSAEGPLSGR